MVIAVDFDGVLSSGRPDGTKFPPPIPGARDAISRLREGGHEILVHSANDPAYIFRWMEHHDIRHDGIARQKPAADCYIDDKALRFEGDWGKTLIALNEILEKEARRRAGAVPLA